jgi:hypothetical protein
MPLYSFISRCSVILVGYVKFNASVILSNELDRMSRKESVQFNFLTQDLSGWVALTQRTLLSIGSGQEI